MARRSLLDFQNTTLHQTSTSAGGFFTVNTAENWIVDSGHGRAAGDLVSFTTDNALPSSLVVGVIYSILEIVSSVNFTITLDGDNEIDITDTGTGTHAYVYYDTSVTLENFTVTKDQAIERGFWQESVLTHHREWVTGGQHWIIGIKSNFFKVGSISTRRTNFDELFGYKAIDLYVSRVIEDSASAVVIRDSSGVPVEFIMTRFETSFLTQANYEDIVTIELESKDFVDMSETV